jgi:prophage antirepressor-like protein
MNYKGVSLRTVEINGELWWVLKDVCNILDIKNSGDVASRLDDDEKGVGLIDTLGGKQNMVIINEFGLNSVILLSAKPEAKQFKRWVTHEVLPSIRKHGGYLTQDKIQEALLNPDVLIQLATTLKEEMNKNKILQPKADYYDNLIEVGCNLNFRDTAKELGVKEKTFTNYLVDNGYCYRDIKGILKPYAKYVNKYFVLREFCNGVFASSKTLITIEGRSYFLKMVERNPFLKMPGKNTFLKMVGKIK